MTVEKSAPKEETTPAEATDAVSAAGDRPEGPPNAPPAARLNAGSNAADRPKSRRSALIAVVIIVILIALGVGGGVAWKIFSDRLGGLQAANQDLKARIDALSRAVDTGSGKLAPLAGRIDALSEKLTQIAQTPQSAEPPAELLAKLKDLGERLTRVEQDVQTMAARHLAASELNDRLTRLESQAVHSAAIERRLDALEAGGKTLSRAAEVVLAIGQVTQALRDGAPFEKEVRSLQMIAGRDQALVDAAKALEPYAATGVPTLAQLTSEFPAVALAVSRGEHKTAEGEWYERVASRLTTLVSVRRTGPAAIAEGGTTGALAEAEAALDAGELAPAVAAMARIEGPGAAAAAPWLKSARARLAADAALNRLEDQALVNLSELKGE